MNGRMWLGMGLLFPLLMGTVSAQDNTLAELYGQGVHAYFSRDLQTAHEFFSSAIQQGSRDPRCYFYRGLTYASLGRPQEADADFKMGAKLEVEKADRVYPVADSLQRVQGRTRVQLERYRQLARLTSHSKGSTAQQARFDELKKAEAEVLRNPARPAAAPAAVAEPPATVASDPFGGAAAPEAAPEKAAEKPAAAATAETPAAPAAADPFGTPAATPPADAAAPATPPADDSKTDPFSDDKPAAPAAPAEPAAPAAPPAAPAAPATPPASDDPFGT